MRPNATAFPFEADFNSPAGQIFEGRHVTRTGNIGRYGVLTYDDVWTKLVPERSLRLGSVDVYSTSLFMYPLDFAHSNVRVVKCEKPDTFCKGYALYRGKWVEFLVFKDELAEIDQLGQRILEFMSRYTRE